MVLIFCGKTSDGLSYYRDPSNNLFCKRYLDKFEECDFLPFEAENFEFIVLVGKFAYQMSYTWNEIYLNYGDIETIENNQSFVGEEEHTPKIKRCRKKSDFYEIPFPDNDVFDLLLSKYVEWGGKADNFLIDYQEGLIEYSQKLF